MSWPALRPAEAKFPTTHPLGRSVCSPQAELAHFLLQWAVTTRSSRWSLWAAESPEILSTLGVLSKCWLWVQGARDWHISAIALKDFLSLTSTNKNFMRKPFPSKNTRVFALWANTVWCWLDQKTSPSTTSPRPTFLSYRKPLLMAFLQIKCSLQPRSPSLPPTTSPANTLTLHPHKPSK